MALAGVTEQLISEMTAVVVRESEPTAIVLFGSHVTGNAGPDSDVDLLVVNPRALALGNSRRHEMVRLWQALAEFPVAKDILIYTSEEIEQWRNSRNHIVARALREGRILYGQL